MFGFVPDVQILNCESQECQTRLRNSEGRGGRGGDGSDGVLLVVALLVVALLVVALLVVALLVVALLVVALLVVALWIQLVSVEASVEVVDCCCEQRL